MEKIFRQLLDNNFADLAGLHADATIPVPQQLVNELLAAQLAGNRKITACLVSIHEQNRMDIHLKTPLVPWTLDLKLKLFHSVDLESRPKLRAFLENNILLSKIGSALRAFPEGISLYGDQLTIDLGMFLNSEEQKRLLELVKSVEIRTEQDKLILDVRIEK